MDHHRSGPLKQKNKPHKGPKKKQRKDSLSSTRSLRSISKKGYNVSRIVRKNQLIQQRKTKRDEFLKTRRGIVETPILISVLDLGSSKDRLVQLLNSFDSTAQIFSSKRGGFHLELHKFHSKYQIVFLDRHDLFGSLDYAKISDLLLVVHSTNVEEFETTENDDKLNIFDAIYYHCLPQSIHSVIGLNQIASFKHKDKIKKSILELIEKKYKGSSDGSNKLRSLDSAQDLLQLFHYCSNIKRKSNSYCYKRSQILAEEFNFVPNSEDPSIGTLLVDGYIHNNPLNVNSLVYIPEFGEFQLEKIETVDNPYAFKMNNTIHYIEQANPELRSNLEKENKVETIFEEDIRAMEEDMNQSTILEKKKVPKGTSDYQASWIVESDAEDDNDVTDDEDEEEVDSNITKHVHFAPVDEPNELNHDSEELEQMDESEVESQSEANYDEQCNMDEEMETLEKFKEQRMYELFPDELDTPIDRPARERFIKYRGLKSFRTSNWDTKENLPPDYSRIFQFENFNRTRRRLYKTEPVGADPGYYVRVHVINVPAALVEHFHNRPNKPLVLYELLAHEHKMSVQNLVIKKLASFSEPIRSKERLIFHIGCRRFAAKPIFSAHTIGDKHKFEKFLRTDIACVATLFAPITFPPASVLVYKEFPDGTHNLVATGSLLDCSPDRLVIKRIILSGHPFKINRKHAVVRYMFFNRDDILWFRPVELSTKYGRRGHIQEPLGTHGHMKCVFDHQLTSQDTVLMSLYKRVFPKWYYENTDLREPIMNTNEDNTMLIDAN